MVGGGRLKNSQYLQAIGIDIRYLIQPPTVTPYNEKGGEVNPVALLYTETPPNVGHAG